MAPGKSYARFVLLGDRFPEFRQALRAAKFDALAEASQLAAEGAKRLEARHNKSGDTNASIFGAPFAAGFALHVGTLQGVFLEYGTKDRYAKSRSNAYRGREAADPYLRPAAILAAQSIPMFVERKMRGIKAFVPARGQVRISYRETSTGQFAGSAGSIPMRAPY